MIYEIREIRPDDQRAMDNIHLKYFKSTRLSYNTELIELKNMAGFVAVDASGNVIGAIMGREQGDILQLVSIACTRQGEGIGTALMDKFENEARQDGLRGVMVNTTNDNTKALRFYQKRGYFLHEVRLNNIKDQRTWKPEIPETGDDNIPMRDEIDLVKWL